MFVTLLYLLTQFVLSEKVKEVWLRLNLFLTGITVPLFLFGLFAYNEGWLADYLYTTVEVIVFLSGINLPNGQGLPHVIVNDQVFSSPLRVVAFLFSKNMLYYWSLLILVVYLVISFIRFLLSKKSTGESIVVLTTIFALLSYMSTVGRSGHAFVLVPFVVVLGSYFLSLLQFKHIFRGKQLITAVLLFLFVLYITRYLMIFRQSIYSTLFERPNVHSAVPRVSPLAITERQARSFLDLQAFFNTYSKPTDKIFVFNNSPILYEVLDRQNATRYDLPLLAYSNEQRVQVVNSLRENRPTFIVEDQKAWAVDGVSDRKRLPEVITYILENYRKEAVVGNYIIYKKNS